MKKDIKSREDVFLLITTFYGRIRKDELLGPFFNKHIHDWESHFERLTDFWETNLFFVKKFKGNPLQKHQEVDTAHDHKISEYHFGIWLNHWFQTLDELFEGENTEKAKARARNMGSFMYLQMFKSRSSKNGEKTE
ncbi:globin [Leptobacterium flavescens]|uniref:Globin n=1 Tax=Leptobacterium flavescens TaxID=472055 RepID=A0A6P0UPX4_9FLAO|nr:group III truncated hemoglobin [Leptobacterium flavescens]NER14028.1 globin [Leptobacterium flavescens]